MFVFFILIRNGLKLSFGKYFLLNSIHKKLLSCTGEEVHKAAFLRCRINALI
jgi:hypothetical protein